MASEYSSGNDNEDWEDKDDEIEVDYIDKDNKCASKLRSPSSINHNGNNNNKQKVEPLPMPPKKLNSIYTSKLFDPSNTPTNNPKEHAALEYLIQTRGLHCFVLRKYGVGCALYNFPDKNATNGISYVASMCMTFPPRTRQVHDVTAANHYESPPIHRNVIPSS